MNENELEKKIRKVYKRATEEMTAKMEAYLDQFEKDIDIMSKKVESGEITKKYFNKWKRDQVMLYNQWSDTREKLGNILLDADDLARDIIKGSLTAMMADGINRTFFDVEQIKEVGEMGISFNLTDEHTVKRLIRDNPRLLPLLDEESKTAQMIREGKAKRWNQQHITAEVTQGIIQGEPMQKIAGRMMNVTGMNYRSAIRNARTATGSAYNAGKIEGMRQAEAKGVKMLKRWSAIFDDKTRDAHRVLDGVTIPLDEKFEVDGYELEFPRDPNGEPEMIYNCRCRLISVPALVADKFDEIFDKEGRVTQSGQTYEEWKEGKQKAEPESASAAREVSEERTPKEPETVVPSIDKWEEMMEKKSGEPDFFDHMMELEEKTLGNLSEDEKNAINDYTGDAFMQINSFLRGRSGLDDEHQEIYDNLKSAFDKIEIGEDMILRRGTDAGDMTAFLNSGSFSDDKFYFQKMLNEEKFDELNEKFGGSVARINGFTSTSSHRELGFNKNLEIMYFAPKNTKGSSVMSVSFYNQDEAEVLLAPMNVKWLGIEKAEKIVGVKTKYRLFLQIIP